MLKSLSRFYLLALAGLVQIIAISCSKDAVEPPIPHVTQTQATQPADHEEVSNLKSLFTARRYDEILSSLLNTKTSSTTTAWGWVPIWEEAVQRGGANHAKYVFVPLEPKHATNTSEITVFGYRRYLRFK